jgi:hypothetical protein
MCGIDLLSFLIEVRGDEESYMRVKKILAQGAIAAVLGGSALGAGVVPANAEPDWEFGEHDEWVDNDWRGQEFTEWRGNDWGDLDWKGWDDRQEWKRWNDHDWDKWWRVNKWRNDDRPPWGWGGPPPVYWKGHVPHWIDYWGFRVFPVWHPHIKVFGFWLFGIFIPVFVI